MALQAGRDINLKAADPFLHLAIATVEKLLAPLTATTSGVGKIIQARFDRLAEVEKINGAVVVQKAREKIERCGRPMTQEVNASVVVFALEEAGMQTEPTLQELWSNLLAQEFTRGGVHPEIPRLLARLTAEDAENLAVVAKNQWRVRQNHRLRAASTSIASENQAGILTRALGRPTAPTLSQAVLRGANLIEKLDGGGWVLTVFGKAFVEAVTDPTIEVTATERKVEPAL